MTARGRSLGAVLSLAVILLAVSVAISVTIGQADLAVREVWTIATDRLGIRWLRLEALGLHGIDGVSDLRAKSADFLVLGQRGEAVRSGGGTSGEQGRSTVGDARVPVEPGCACFFDECVTFLG